MGTRSGDIDPGALGLRRRPARPRPGRGARRAQHARAVCSGCPGSATTCARVVDAADAWVCRRRAGRGRVLLPRGQGRRRARRARSAGLDAVVFTGGIGEHAPEVARGRARPPRRARAARGRRRERRRTAASTGGRISAPGPVQALVVPTDEELRHRPRHPWSWPDDPHRCSSSRPATGVGLTATCLGLVRRAAAARRRRRVLQAARAAAGQRRGSGPLDRAVRLTSSLRPPEPIPSGTGGARAQRGRARHASWRRSSRPPSRCVAAHDVRRRRGSRPRRSGFVYAGRGEPRAGQGARRRRAARRGAATDDDADHLAETMAIAARTYRAGEHDRVVGAVVNRMPDGRAGACDRLRAAPWPRAA